MAKLSLALLALVAALLVVADASIVRTTITTTEIDEDNPHHGGGSSTYQQQCPTRRLQGRRFNSCQRYLTKSSRSPYNILRVVDVNPFSQEKEMLEECCDELREVQQQLQNPQCACEALKKIIRDEREQGSSRFQGQQGMKPLLQKARSIPEQCNIQVKSCRFQEY